MLLIHGADDGIVPLAQSVAMRKALAKAGRDAELITLADEGHSRWSKESERQALSSIDRFLWTHLGPGIGVTEPPAPQAPSKK